MARLNDVATVCHTIGVAAFAKRVWSEISDDDLFTWAAALAYSWLFAIFPFLLFLLTLVPYLPENTKDKAREEIHEMIVQTLPGTEAQNIVWQNVDKKLEGLIDERRGKLLPRLASLGLALWAASGGMVMTMTALDKVYELERGRAFYHKRSMAVGMTIAVACLMVLVVSLLPVGTFLKHWLEREYPYWKDHPLLIVFDVVRWTLSILFLITVLAIIYHKGVSVRHRFHWITPGAVFSIVAWIVLGLAFRLYVTKYAKYGETYGTVGGVVVLLLFFYIDALVLLIGAQINSEIDFEVLKLQRGTRDFRRAEDRAAGVVAPPGDDVESPAQSSLGAGNPS